MGAAIASGGTRMLTNDPAVIAAVRPLARPLGARANRHKQRTPHSLPQTQAAHTPFCPSNSSSAHPHSFPSYHTVTSPSPFRHTPPLFPFFFPPPGLSLLLTGPVCAGEGTLLARRQLGFLAGVYALSTAVLPFVLLGIKRRGPVSAVWTTFALFQMVRAFAFTARVWLPEMRRRVRRVAAPEPGGRERAD